MKPQQTQINSCMKSVKQLKCSLMSPKNRMLTWYANLKIVLVLNRFNIFCLKSLQQARINELIQNSGDNSAQLTSLNEKLKEKEK